MPETLAGLGQLSVILPAYNEARRLPATLASIRRWLDAAGQSAEILIVNDGSTDATAAVVEEQAKQDKRVRPSGYTVNRGKGYAVRTGVAAARGDWLLLMDADNATPIEEVAKLWQAHKHAEVIVGSRYLNERLRRDRPLLRTLLSRFGNGLIRLLLVPGIRDTQCGFKLFSAAAAKRSFAKAHVDRWGFDFEVLAIAKRLGYRIVEVPVVWHDAEGSHLRASRAAWSTLRELFATWWRLRQIPRAEAE